MFFVVVANLWNLSWSIENFLEKSRVKWFTRTTWVCCYLILRFEILLIADNKMIWIFDKLGIWRRRWTRIAKRAHLLLVRHGLELASRWVRWRWTHWVLVNCRRRWGRVHQLDGGFFDLCFNKRGFKESFNKITREEHL